MEEFMTRNVLALTNPNKAWVDRQLDILMAEWRAWQDEVEVINYPPIDPLDPKPQTSIYADEEGNLRKHRFLQEKTLVFLDNNITGHGFITRRDGTRIDDTSLWLKNRVKQRIDDLDELRACLPYAKVPEAYWKAKAKDMLDNIKSLPLDGAIDVASKFLQGL
jgi:hypothetical protein